jgi:hypothetical protein
LRFTGFSKHFSSGHCLFHQRLSACAVNLDIGAAFTFFPSSNLRWDDALSSTVTWRASTNTPPTSLCSPSHSFKGSAHAILRTPSLLAAPSVHLAIEIPVLPTADRTAFHSLLIQRIRLGDARLHLKVASPWAWCPSTYSSHDDYTELENVVWYLVAAVPSEIVDTAFRQPH